MVRKAYYDLMNWKNNNLRKPLIIYGSRQIGKTYLVLEVFAKDNFNNYIYIDFKIENEIRKYIKNHPKAIDIINYLSLKFQKVITDDTLIIFDEVQECLPAITSLSDFYTNYPSVPVIATGSFVSMRVKMASENELALDNEIDSINQDGTNNYRFPSGCVEELNMYPLTFDEYLSTIDKEFYDELNETYILNKRISNKNHNQAMKYFYDYLLIGGMPKAVDTFKRTNNYIMAREELKTIYNEFKNDMNYYQKSLQSVNRSKMVFDNIYSQLNKENKNFKFSNIEAGKKYRDYEYPLDWLNEAGLIYPSFQMKEEVKKPLETTMMFKLYMPDTGLFAMQSNVSPDKFINDLTNNELSEIFTENYIACELAARGKKLYYWKGKTSSELEFLIENDDELIPIETKRSRKSLDSLYKYRELNDNKLAIKLSSNKYCYSEENKVLTLPYYYLPFYLNELCKKIDVKNN